MDYGHSEDMEIPWSKTRRKLSQIVVEQTAFGLRYRDCWLNSAFQPLVSQQNLGSDEVVDWDELWIDFKRVLCISMYFWSVIIDDECAPHTISCSVKPISSDLPTNSKLVWCIFLVQMICLIQYMHCWEVFPSFLLRTKTGQQKWTHAKAKGYMGALYHNRQLTCCFCSCNLFLSILSVAWLGMIKPFASNIHHLIHLSNLSLLPKIFDGSTVQWKIFHFQLEAFHVKTHFPQSPSSIHWAQVVHTWGA